MPYRTFTLPVVGTGIDPRGFFVFAPLLLLAAYFYFHLMLTRLFGCYHALLEQHEASKGTDTPHILESLVPPWFLTVLTDPESSDIEGEKRLDFHPVAFHLAWFFAYAFTPLTVFALSFRYLRAHDAFLTFAHTLLTTIIVVAAALFWLKRCDFCPGERGAPDEKTPPIAAKQTAAAQAAVIATLFGTVCLYLFSQAFIASGFRPYHPLVFLSPNAQLYRAELSKRPAGWDEIRWIQLQDFYEEWEKCTKDEITLGSAGERVNREIILARLANRDADCNQAILSRQPENSIQDLQSELALRLDISIGAQLGRIPAPGDKDDALNTNLVYCKNENEEVLVGKPRDLRHAFLMEAHLVGANLDCVDLSGADLRRARMDQASLWGANLTGADLKGAWLSGAKLNGALLKSAILSDLRTHSAAIFDEGLQCLTSAKQRNELIKSLSSLMNEKEFDGLCLDFAGAGATQAEEIAAFLLAVKAEFHRWGKESCIVAEIDDALLMHPKAADLADRLVVLAFQEPGPFSGPTPLAPLDWYEEKLSVLLDSIPAEKLVIALGNFGMDWVSGKPNPEYLTFFDITEAVDRNKGSIGMDRESLNSEASFSDAQGRRHQIWFLDALSAHNQLARTPLDRIGGVAIWPVTGGDPGIWELLSPGFPELNTASSLLQRIGQASHVRYTGKGPLLTVQNPATPGRRILAKDPESGLITDANYLELPRAFTVSLSGALPKNSAVLTFDDGPNKKYTPKILDILKEYNVPAVFFVVGNRVQISPEIARRIVEEGHELGVHTYTHPNIADISDLRLKLELHASQELIESVSGLNTNLFRAPYGFDENPETPKEASVLSLLTNERYVVVGIEIDSTDWTRPGADKIVETVTSLVQSGQGNVILFHDAGGDREQTVLALPKIIEALDGMGVSIVPLSSVTGQGAGFQSGEVAQAQDQISTYSFWFIRSLKTAITAVFFFLITVGIVRSLAVLVLALIKERRVHKSGDAKLPVTVLIPAYCEETVITKSVTSVLQSTYPIEQVIVIDDGSTDETAKVVVEHFGSDPRVRLVRQRNQGKAEALYHGIGLIETPVFVAIDADTIIAPDAIGQLVKHFNDAKVGAVAGNVKVGNRRNLLTRLQAIEYITAQNLDRRAFEVLNGIMVVPGSIGAWRTDAVKVSGGYTTQTLVEDADLTVSIIRNGYQVVFEPKAHAFTEAPETIPQWMRQRLRWHFGMLQIAWKHKSAFFERRAVGMVSIPDLVLFGAVFSLFAPIADIVMVVNLIALAEHFTDAPQLPFESSTVLVAISYIAYLLSDLVLATIAFGLEPKENKRLLPWVLTQRFFYRQIYWMVALRSIARAVTGRFTGWRKITRTSSINLANTLGLPRDQVRVVLTDKKAPKDTN